MFKLKSKNDIPLYMDICKEWENRTRMTLEHDEIKKVIQKDVNNYMVVLNNGKVKSKGAYVKELNPLDYDLPIVNKAVKEYFINNTPVEETINNCNELKEFQKIVKVSSKYQYAMHNDEVLSGRVFRVFASRRKSDKGIFKIKFMNPEKISNTPERCFIYNNDINEVQAIRTLNKSWYIEMALKRINDYKGVK